MPAAGTAGTAKPFEFNVNGKGGTSIPPLEGGLYPAVLVRLIDIGTHHDSYQGKPITAKKVVLSWEIVGEYVEIEEDGKKKKLPRMLSQTYTASVHEKAKLRRDLESWRGKPFTKEEVDKFNLGVLLGVSCQINVSVNENKKNDIKAIVPTPKDPTSGKKLVYTPTEPLVGYTIPNEIPANLPKWIVDKIHESDEGKKMPKRTAETQADSVANAPVAEPGSNDGPATEDIPF